MRILITGGSGRIGRELVRVFPQAWAPSRQELDITRSDSVERGLSRDPPDVVIHAAALTDTERCEGERDSAWRTNVTGTESLLEVARRVNPDVYFLYLSTAGVFRGDRGGYSEEDPPYPVNFYCFTKYIGEERVRARGPSCVVRANFVPRGRWAHPRAFVDRWGTYLFADRAAEAIREIEEGRATGTIHLSSRRKMSLYDVARLSDPQVQPMTLKEYQGPALPRDISLVSNRWKTYELD